MNNFKKFIVLSLLVGMLSGNVAFAGAYDGYDPDVVQLESYSNVIHADIKSERIPAGTTFNVRMETPVNSYNFLEGDTFRANLLSDIRIGKLVVLPAGTMLRGSVASVDAGSRFTQPGELSLKFDHAVTPIGKQIPLAVEITKANHLTDKGTFKADGGYWSAVSNNWSKGAKVLTTTTKYCVDKGMSVWQGVPVAVTAPLGAFTGAIAGGSYFVGKSVYNMFKKGENVKVNPGDILEVVLEEPMDVPVN